MSLFPAHPDEVGDELERVIEILEMASENNELLSEWEEGFVHDMLERIDRYGRRTRISERQMEIIERIDEKFMDDRPAPF